MANLSTIHSGINGRMSMLLNNDKFSDVIFYVKKNDGEFEKFYAHKLVLAVASETFGHMFYDSNVVKPQIKLTDVNPATFLTFLKYLYMDQVEFSKVSEANELYNLAKKYGVTALGEKCLQYILKDKIILENLFAKYDCAIGENVKELLMVCRNFVCCNTSSVLNSPQFVNASTTVVQDIIKQDYLNIDNELDVIYAVLKWGKNECKRRGIPQGDCYVRDSISCHLKYLRFLSLTAEEFCDFVEENDIFSGHESSILTRKILQPNRQFNIPEIFCKFTNKRNGIPYVEDKHVMPEYNEIVSSKSNIDIGIKNPFNSLDPVEHYDSFIHSSLKFHVQPLEQKHDALGKKSDVAILNAPKYPKKLEDSSNCTPVHKVAPYSFHKPKFNQNFLKKFTFDMPLCPMQKGIKYAFENDIKCIVQLKMIRGDMDVCGIELKIKNRLKPLDEMEVFLSLTGFTEEPMNDVYEKELKNDTLELLFPKPQKLMENRQAQIEITIESLRLDRCNICLENKRRSELNCGLSTMSEIFLTSNQPSEDGIIFFISRIIYMPCLT